MRSLTGLPTTRRATVGGVLGGLLALTGCDAGRPDPRHGDAPGAAPPEEPDEHEEAAEPDSALVDRVVDELDELEAIVEAASGHRPALAPRLAGLAAAHRAHRAVLTERTPSGPQLRLPSSSQELLAEVLRRERVGQDRLARWALEAQSGALARLLASMSASIAAHLAVETGDRGAGR